MKKPVVLVAAIALAVIISGCASNTANNSTPTGEETISKYFTSLYVSSDCAPSADHHEPIRATVFNPGDSFCLVTKQATMSFTMTIKTISNGAVVDTSTANIAQGYSSTSGGGNPYSKGTYQMELYANNNNVPFATLPFEVK